jgi:hypothetical protein
VIVPLYSGSGAGLDIFAARLDPDAATKLKPAALLRGSGRGEDVLICWVSITPALASWISTGGLATGNALATTSSFASGIIGLRYEPTDIASGQN